MTTPDAVHIGQNDLPFVMCGHSNIGRGVPDVQSLDKERVPGCTYCRPQVASVGMTEAQARASGKSINIGRFDPHGSCAIFQ